MKPTIFTYLSNILYKKSDNVFRNIDSEDTYNHYMMCRWLSMHSPEVAKLVNETANWLYPIFNTKEESYKFLNTIIPYQSFRRINYIKKNKKKTDKKDETITDIIAQNMEISKREVNLYVKQLNLDLEKYENNYGS